MSSRQFRVSGDVKNWENSFDVWKHHRSGKSRNWICPSMPRWYGRNEVLCVTFPDGLWPGKHFIKSLPPSSSLNRKLRYSLQGGSCCSDGEALGRKQDVKKTKRQDLPGWSRRMTHEQRVTFKVILVSHHEWCLFSCSLYLSGSDDMWLLFRLRFGLKPMWG